MTKLFKTFTLMFTVVFLATAASSQPVTPTQFAGASSFAEAAQQAAGFLNIPDPTPICFPLASPGSPTHGISASPSPTMGVLRKFCAQTNNLKTAISVDLVDWDRYNVQVYLDTDRDFSTGDSRLLKGKEYSGFDRTVTVTRYGVDIYDARPNGNRHLGWASARDGQFILPVSVLGPEGKGAARVLVVVYSNQSGEVADIFPSTGYAMIPSTLSVRLLPVDGNKFFPVVGADGTFDLVAEVDSMAPSSQVTLTWESNGDNVTERFNQQVTEAVKMLRLSAGMPINGFVRRIHYPFRHVLVPEVTFTVIAVSPIGVAYDTVKLSFEPVLEPPTSFPTPPPALPTVPVPSGPTAPMPQP